MLPTAAEPLPAVDDAVLAAVLPALAGEIEPVHEPDGHVLVQGAGRRGLIDLGPRTLERIPVEFGAAADDRGLAALWSRNVSTVRMASSPVEQIPTTVYPNFFRLCWMSFATMLSSSTIRMFVFDMLYAIFYLILLT